MTFKDQLIALNACQEALDWVDTTNGTIDDAWNLSPEAEWLLWMLEKAPVPLDRDTCADMAFDFIKRIEHLNKTPEISEILSNAKKRRTKVNPNAPIFSTEYLEKHVIGKNAPDVKNRPAEQAIFQAGQTTNPPDFFDDRKIIEHLIHCAVWTHRASMKEVMDSLPRGSHDQYLVRDREIRDDQLKIIRKHVPLKKIKELWTFP